MPCTDGPRPTSSVFDRPNPSGFFWTILSPSKKPTPSSLWSGYFCLCLYLLNMKVIKLTESDLTNIVKRVIKESNSKNSLINLVREDGWQTASKFVGGIENLKRLLRIETPMDFLNIFTDLDVIQSEEEPDWTLFRYEKGNNMMIYNRKNKDVYINYHDIWVFLDIGFGLNNSEIKGVMKEWLSEVYNLRGVIPRNKKYLFK